MPEDLSHLPAPVVALGQRARVASRVLATTPSPRKDAALRAAADLLEARADDLAAANELDLAEAAAGGMEAGPLDRLRLTPARLAGMATGLRTVADLPDPIGEVVGGWRRPNGLDIRQERVPLGVITIIYENRPNVTSDAAGLCLKSGNAVILRGSASALRSNRAIAAVLREAVAGAGLPADAVQLVDDPSHETAAAVMQLTGLVDCLIPRGGPALIRSIQEHATVPVIIDGDGNCQIYVDAAADLEMAVDVILNAKTQRPSVCNAAETLLVHEAVAAELLPRVGEKLVGTGVELRADARATALLAAAGVPSTPVTDDDFAREFLDLVLAVGVVPSLDAAVEHVNRFSSGHTEAILSDDLRAVQRFCAEVDSGTIGTIVVNASTRFTDGEEFGYGAEIGISTQKLHARGPMGLRALTTTKTIVTGTGQVRT
jgi:glutamate-5-semialdehyde dehydrogenase